jgi:peptidoglycan L-alanyl-D-glutamate endopeptidase CwlK
MRHFSTSSSAKLRTCHKDLQVLFNHVIQEYDCTIVCGHRGEEEQNEAFANGYSQLKWPQSKHNQDPSLAVDAVPYEVTGLDWGRLQSAHFSGYVKGIADQLYRIGTMQYKIRCGIDWDNDKDIDDTKFWDAGHFELIFDGERRYY